MMSDSSWYECEMLVGLKIKNYASAHIRDILKGMKSCGNCLCKMTAIIEQSEIVRRHKGWRFGVKYLPSKDGELGRRKVDKVWWNVPIAIMADNGRMMIIPNAEIIESSALGFEFNAKYLNTPRLASVVVCDYNEIKTNNEQK